MDAQRQKVQYINHKKRVKNARQKGFPLSLNKSLVENSSQTRLNNAKTAAMEAERVLQIEKQNQNLWVKMKEIEMGQMNTMNNSHIRQSHNLITGKISNARSKIRNIENENLKLLKRISAVSPTYQNSKMKLDRKKQVQLLKRKGKYPYVENQSRTEAVPTLNHSGSQSMNGPFYTVSSRSHLNNFGPQQLYSSPDGPAAVVHQS